MNDREEILKPGIILAIPKNQIFPRLDISVIKVVRLVRIVFVMFDNEGGVKMRVCEVEGARPDYCVESGVIE